MWLIIWRFIIIVGLVNRIRTAPHPGWDKVMSVATFLLSATLVFYCFISKKYIWGILFIVVFFIYNPIFPLHFEEINQIWIDLGTAALLGVSLLIIKPKNLMGWRGNGDCR